MTCEERIIRDFFYVPGVERNMVMFFDRDSRRSNLKGLIEMRDINVIGYNASSLEELDCSRPSKQVMDAIRQRSDLDSRHIFSRSL